MGDFDPDALAKLVEELFGDWQNPAPYARIPARYFERRAARADRARRRTRRTRCCAPAINLPLRDDNPDFPALVLGNYLLGGTLERRACRRACARRKACPTAPTACSAPSAQDAVGSFGVSAIFAPQNRERVERAIREELARALAQGFSDAEVEAGEKGLLEARRVQRARRTARSPARLANYLYLGRTFAWDIELEERIAALTPDEVRDALRRHLDLEEALGAEGRRLQAA